MSVRSFSARYLVLRIVHAVSILLAVSVLSFLFVELAPGDYFDRMSLDPSISQETLDEMRIRYGLDRSLPERYSAWLVAVARGSWGYSFAYRRPVAPLLWPRVRNTLLLGLCAAALAWTLAVPAGILWAFRRRPLSSVLGGLTSVAVSVPEVVLALAALAFAANLRVLPVGGMTSLDAASLPPLARFGDLLRHLVLPVSVLALPAFAVLARHVRSAVADVLDEPHVLQARALGETESTVLWHSLLRAAASPLLAVASLSVATLLSGSFIVEVVMGWPGLGLFLLEAIRARDVHVVIGAVVCSALLVVAGRLATDVLQEWNDPRIASR